MTILLLSSILFRVTTSPPTTILITIPSAHYSGMLATMQNYKLSHTLKKVKYSSLTIVCVVFNQNLKDYAIFPDKTSILIRKKHK